MRIYNGVSRALRALSLAFLSAVILRPTPAVAQQDINIVGGTNPYIVIGRGMQWGGSGFGNLNNNFIFTPVNPDEGFCLFLTNNNPSNAHSVTVSVNQTGDPAVNTFQATQFKWTNVPTAKSFPVSVPAQSVLGINYKTNASASIDVTFSGATTQAGSPDTVDVFAVQTTQSSCGALPVNSVQGPFQQNSSVTLAAQFPVLVGGLAAPGSTTSAQAAHIGTNGNGWLEDGGVCCQAFASGFQSNPASNFSNFKSATGPSTELETVIDNFSLGFFGAKGTAPGFVKTNFLEIATDQFWQAASATPAWVTLGKVTNPAANGVILSHFKGNSTGANPAYKTLTLSCSAACELIVARITARGTTCTALTAQNLQLGNNGTVLALQADEFFENACTGAPTLGTTFFDLSLAAGIPVNLDLSGYVNFHNATAGSGLVVEALTGLTGVATASLSMSEQ